MENNMNVKPSEHIRELSKKYGNNIDALSFGIISFLDEQHASKAEQNAAQTKEFSGYMTETPMHSESQCEHVWIAMYGTHDEIVRYDCARCKISKPIVSQGVQNDSCERDEVEELEKDLLTLKAIKRSAGWVAEQLISAGYSKRATPADKRKC